ncbi:MAG: hypothetical protein FJ117_11385 [Deltaproteobacteria bacterium]|nr:hypothetical protein [Deltaproteobacteria bacterium]
MTKIEEIEHAVDLLPIEEYPQFHKWFLERDWSAWDLQIEADSAAGKLDFLLKEAGGEKKLGRLKDLLNIARQGVSGIAILHSQIRFAN